jgi:hypothetical protein
LLIGSLVLGTVGLAGCFQSSPPPPSPTPPPPPLLDVYPRDGSFWATPTGDTPVVTFHVHNDSYRQSTGTMQISIRNAVGTGAFVIQDDQCSGSEVSSPGECLVTIQYQNTTGTGTLDAEVHATDTTGNGGDAQALLGGHGVPGGLEVRFGGGEFVDSPSTPGPTLDWTVRNTSAKTSGPVTADIQHGPIVGTFTVVPSGPNNCVGATLAPAAACTLRIRYDNDTGSGTDRADCSITAPPVDPDPNNPVVLLGRGVPAA